MNNYKTAFNIELVEDWHNNVKLQGIMAYHIDDFIYGGCIKFHEHVLSKIRNLFHIGMEEDTHLNYHRLKISQDSSGILLSNELCN